MSNEHGIIFPFEPYPQQQKLMNSIFETIESSKSGCFESPTGTGKSLSVICASLHWQSIHERVVQEQCERQIEEGKSSTKKEASSDDWLADMLSASTTDDKSTEKAARQKGALPKDLHGYERESVILGESEEHKCALL